MPDLSAAYLPALRRDIQDIMMWSEEHFGALAAECYAALIRQALHDLHADPMRPGAKARPDLAPNAYVYHLAFSRDRVKGDRVRAPRHFMLYRLAGRTVEFARLLHDSFDLACASPSDRVPVMPAARREASLQSNEGVAIR